MGWVLELQVVYIDVVKDIYEEVVTSEKKLEGIQMHFSIAVCLD